MYLHKSWQLISVRKENYFSFATKNKDFKRAFDFYQYFVFNDLEDLKNLRKKISTGKIRM